MTGKMFHGVVPACQHTSCSPSQNPSGNFSVCVGKKGITETTSPLPFLDHTYWALDVLFREVPKPREAKPKPRD